MKSDVAVFSTENAAILKLTIKKIQTMTEKSTKQKPVKMTHQEKLEKLKRQESQLKARIQMMENKTNEEKRKKENRVKFLMGAFLLEGVTKETEKFSSIFNEFKKFLTRERDQVLVENYFKQ